MNWIKLAGQVAIGVVGVLGVLAKAINDAQEGSYSEDEPKGYSKPDYEQSPNDEAYDDIYWEPKEWTDNEIDEVIGTNQGTLEGAPCPICGHPLHYVYSDDTYLWCDECSLEVPEEVYILDKFEIESAWFELYIQEPYEEPEEDPEIEQAHLEGITFSWEYDSEDEWLEDL